MTFFLKEFIGLLKFFEKHVYRSKSVSDITEDETNLSASTIELRFEELQKMRARLQENEDKWQDVSIGSHGFVIDNIHTCSCLACVSVKVETSKMSS